MTDFELQLLDNVKAIRSGMVSFRGDMSGMLAAMTEMRRDVATLARHIEGNSEAISELRLRVGSIERHLSEAGER